MNMQVLNFLIDKKGLIKFLNCNGTRTLQQ